MSGLVKPAFSVTIIQPPGFLHSHAFDEVAETIYHGLRALGHEAMILGLTCASFMRGPRHILLGGDNLHAIGLRPADVPADTIFYNWETSPERLERTISFVHAMPDSVTVWDYCKRNLPFWKFNKIDAVHVPIGYAPEMSRLKLEEPIYDVVFTGAVSPRRQRILDGLKEAGLSVYAFSEPYGVERDAKLTKARVVLNVHYHDHIRTLEMARLSWLFSNKIAVVSEQSEDEGRFFKENACTFVPYENLVQECQFITGIVRDGREFYTQMGRRGFEVFSKILEKDILASALSR